MGLLRQLRRAFKNLLSDLFSRKKKDRITSRSETVKVPRSWKKGDPVKKEPRVKIIEQPKVRIPGLRTVKRIIWGFLLLLNFIFSQFLLGALGSEGQPMFIIFLLNSWALLELLWKTRGKKKDA